MRFLQVDFQIQRVNSRKGTNPYLPESPPKVKLCEGSPVSRVVGECRVMSLPRRSCSKVPLGRGDTSAGTTTLPTTPGGVPYLTVNRPGSHHPHTPHPTSRGTRGKRTKRESQSHAEVPPPSSAPSRVAATRWRRSGTTRGCASSTRRRRGLPRCSFPPLLLRPSPPPSRPCPAPPPPPPPPYSSSSSHPSSSSPCLLVPRAPCSSPFQLGCQTSQLCRSCGSPVTPLAAAGELCPTAPVRCVP